MNASSPDAHGPALVIARSSVGAVTQCPCCGVLTLTLQYISLRLEPPAFRDLQRLLAFAQSRLDSDPAATLGSAAASSDAPPVH